MQAVNNLVSKAKDAVDSALYPHDDPHNSTPSTSAQARGITADKVTSSGPHALATDRGDATFSGDIERESGAGVSEGAGSAYDTYSASGRDNTGSFNGGAHEDVHNQGPGILPGRS
ncbi:hypothetical protein JCM10213_003574 [Rhodosporidiobolus nylandii]